MSDILDQIKEAKSLDINDFVSKYGHSSDDLEIGTKGQMEDINIQDKFGSVDTFKLPTTPDEVTVSGGWNRAKDVITLSNKKLLSFRILPYVTDIKKVKVAEVIRPNFWKSSFKEIDRARTNEMDDWRKSRKYLFNIITVMTRDHNGQNINDMFIEFSNNMLYMTVVIEYSFDADEKKRFFDQYEIS